MYHTSASECKLLHVTSDTKLRQLTCLLDFFPDGDDDLSTSFDRSSEMYFSSWSMAACWESWAGMLWRSWLKLSRIPSASSDTWDQGLINTGLSTIGGSWCFSTFSTIFYVHSRKGKSILLITSGTPPSKYIPVRQRMPVVYQLHRPLLFIFNSQFQLSWSLPPWGQWLSPPSELSSYPYRQLCEGNKK